MIYKDLKQFKSELKTIIANVNLQNRWSDQFDGDISELMDKYNIHLKRDDLRRQLMKILISGNKGRALKLVSLLPDRQVKAVAAWGIIISTALLSFMFLVMALFAAIKLHEVM